MLARNPRTALPLPRYDDDMELQQGVSTESRRRSDSSGEVVSMTDSAVHLHRRGVHRLSEQKNIVGMHVKCSSWSPTPRDPNGPERRLTQREGHTI